jgi:GDP-L-fucose synthase
MRPGDAILVTGAGGLVGVNLVAHLRRGGYENIIAVTSSDCDLTDRRATEALFQRHRPAFVFHLAGFVRGIAGNMRHQAEAYLINTLINIHVVEACRQSGVAKITAMGSVAMYPDLPPDRLLREEMVDQGPPHPSEYGYAMAKRGMAVQLETCRASGGPLYALALSTNLFGPHDRFDIETGHVIPSLVRKFYEAGQNGGTVAVWGDGAARRDFLYVADAVRGLVTIMDQIEGPINLASGESLAIRQAVDILAAHAGLGDRVVWDKSKPSGASARLCDVSRLQKTGFKPDYTLARALAETYDWYAANRETARH